MNLESALKILKENNWIIDHVGGPNYFVSWHFSGGGYSYTARELINAAKDSRTKRTSYVKVETNSKNRSATKQDIFREEYDNFSKNKLRKSGNIWNWD